MDAFTLSAVFMIFFVCLGLHLITLGPIRTVQTVQTVKTVKTIQPIKIIQPIVIPLGPRPPQPLPAVLRQNVAIARLMRMEPF